MYQIVSEGNTELALSYPMGNFRVNPLAEVLSVQYLSEELFLPSQ